MGRPARVLVHSSLGTALPGAALCLALVTAPTAVSAQPSPPAAAPRAPFVEVRLALSSAAAERFAQQRFRRLLAIELEDTGHLAPQASGPLGDHVAYVWIDVTGSDQVSIEVRFAGRSVARRRLGIAKMQGDAAGRLVALATAEMVRNQSRPERPRKPFCPKENSSHEDDLPGAMRLGLVWSGEAAGAWLPSSSTWLAGPGGAVGLLTGPYEQHLFARWLVGNGDTTNTRWFEAGLGARHLLLGRRSWRLSLGASAAAAIVRLVGAQSVAGNSGMEDTWSARASGRAILEGKIAPSAWLGLALEPGGVLHAVPFEQRDAAGKISGAWLGMSVSLSVEHGLRRENAHPH